MADEPKPLCSECGRRIESDDYVAVPHPIAGYRYACHHECRPEQLPWEPARAG
jgi:hypothetical protein